jgi:hypothetical protein
MGGWMDESCEKTSRKTTMTSFTLLYDFVTRKKCETLVVFCFLKFCCDLEKWEEQLFSFYSFVDQKLQEKKVTLEKNWHFLLNFECKVI